MVDGFTVDTSELDRLAADLGRVPSTAGKFIRQAVEVTARHVKDDWRDEAKGMAHAPAFPYSVGYDIGAGYGMSLGQSASAVLSGGIVSAGSSTITAEIGPDKGRAQGALGNLIEWGSINNPPQGLGHGALQRNEADFERGITKALDDAERTAGL